MGARIAISVEDDPTPLVLGLAADLRGLLGEPDFAQRSAELEGTAAIRAATGETATVRVGDDAVSIAHGYDEHADVRAIEDAEIEGAPDHPDLAQWVRELLDPSGADWRGTAQRFWSVLERMPGSPAALLVVNLADGEEQRFGSPDGRAYEVHGEAEDLVAVLSGRLPLLDAAFEGRACLRGTFAEISVLTGAGHAIRHNLEAG